MKSLRGCFLVATPNLKDPNFYRTVVLMVQHGEEGALGLILNRPTELDIAELADDLLVVCDFEQILSRETLATARLGGVNLHGSLLPAYRGRAPVNWAILHGETEAGVTLHYMDAKPDHGDVVGRRAVPIGRDDTWLDVTRKLAGAGRLLLREMVPRLAAGTAPREPQDHAAARYFGGRSADRGEGG